MSFFDFSGNGEKNFEEEDDTDYDALNNETFGENLPALDWEEVHEKLASELACEKTNDFDDDSNEISKSVANFLFIDEGEDDSRSSKNTSKQGQQSQQATGPLAGPVKWWLNGGAPQNVPEQQNKMQIPMDAWWQKPQSAQSAQGPDAAKMPPAKILTVEELEEKMRREAAAAIAVRPITGAHGGPHGAHGPAHPMGHLDDTDIQRMQNHQIQNGHYGRGRGQVMRGRYRHDLMDKPYHAVHHPFPPYPGPAGPIIHPHLRHPGPNFARFDPRTHVGGPRFPRPPYHAPNNFYFNQLPNYPHHDHQPNNFGNSRPPASSHMNDEYAGLMSPQEKQWLASIQLMQLNTNQPYQDDYYFITYQQRQGCAGRKICGTHGQKRETVPSKPASTYTPLQFENSLGKLQIGSVTAPRKIIDMELVESLDHSNKVHEKKSKQILLEIEEMYNLVLKVEDTLNPLNFMRQEENIDAVKEKLLNMATGDGKLVHIMSIRKGKKLVLRMLPVLMFSANLLHRLMVDLVPITRKDSEHNMLLFLPAIRNYLQTVNLATLVEITNNYDNQFLLSNKFTVSVMANLIERANVVQAECTDKGVLDEWNLFLIRLIESTRLWNQPERPVVAVDREVLIRHFRPVMDQVSVTEFNTLLGTLQPATATSIKAPAPEPATI